MRSQENFLFVFLPMWRRKLKMFILILGTQFNLKNTQLFKSKQENYVKNLSTW